MYASPHPSGCLSCCSTSKEFIPTHFKNSSTLSSSWGNCNADELNGRRHGTQGMSLSLESRHKLATWRFICKSAKTTKNKVKFSRDELTESQLEKWQEASGFLEALGFSTEEADKMLAKAFGWVHSPYWSEAAVQTIPELETVSSKTEFLKEIVASEVELTTVLKKFPEVLGCRETLMKHNLGILERDWGISGKILKNVILRNPQVLGYTVDCKGDCMSQCTRCWVRF